MSEEPINTMDGRARRRASPAGMRTRPVRVEPAPPTTTKRFEPGTKVPVVYYLCRNCHLEHPHFMEVPVASPQGLYLRDVISRLDALRGKGMAAMYSWSCKRRYKTGFVWHDLSEDDLLLPAQGTEYVLKASELLFDQSSPPPLPDHLQNSSISNAKVERPKPAQQESPYSRGSQQGWTPSFPPPAATTASAVIKVAVPPTPPQQASPSSSSTIGDDEQCRTSHSGSSDSSSQKSSMPSSGTSSPGALNNPPSAHNEATQTDEKARVDNVKSQQGQQDAATTSTQASPKNVDECHSKRPPAAAGEFSSTRSGTLESLIRAEAAGRRMLEKDDDRDSASSIIDKLKPGNMLMRLCGSSHPGLGLVQTSYKPRLTKLEFPSSPVLAPLGALKPRTIGSLAASETEHYSGRLQHGSASSRKDGVSEEECSKGDPGNMSRRMSDLSSGKIHSSRVVSFRDGNEKVIKIEARP